VKQECFITSYGIALGNGLNETYDMNLKLIENNRAEACSISFAKQLSCSHAGYIL
jgi:hypothetical protein